MSQELYDLGIATTHATNWRLLADVATMQEMRVFCLNEANLCEQAIRRTLLKPPPTKTGEEPGDLRWRIDRQETGRSLKQLKDGRVQVANAGKKHRIHFEAQVEIAAVREDCNIADFSIQYGVHVRACRQLAVWAGGGEFHRARS